jgi:hypothetical protein
MADIATVSARAAGSGSGPMLTAKSIKVVVVLDPGEVAALPEPKADRVTLRVRAGNQNVSADIAGKSVRKARATIKEHGPDGVAVFIQGKFEPGGVIAEAGIVVQVKMPKPAAT